MFVSTVLFVLPGQSMAAAPVVRKVEPPSWWLQHTHNPVRLLLTGDNLQGAMVEAPKGTSATEIEVSENGEYLFADLTISSTATAGATSLKLTTPDGFTFAPFELLEPVWADTGCKGFSTDDVIYLLMPDRFANGDSTNDDPPESRGLHSREIARHYHGGDFQGIEERLTYLQDLGITTLWLTPWYDNANQLNHREKYTDSNQLSVHGVPSTDYHGYGAVDFYRVEEHFGSMADLSDLLQKARSSGFKIIQDQVANHTGPYHPWATNPPTPTWFNGSVEKHLSNKWQVWTVAAINPPTEQLKSTLEGWFIDILPDLNQNDSEASNYLIQNSLWWVGMTGVDGVRQDTLPYVPRTYWSRWTFALKRQFPNLTILGELLDGNPKLVAFFQGGSKQIDGVDTGVDTLFDFPLYYAIREVFAKGGSMTLLADTLAADTNYVDASVLVTFLGLHDTQRFMSESGAGLGGLKQAFTFLLTSRGTPLIYYGDEIAMSGGGDPYNRRDFPGGWSGDKQNAFTASSRTPAQESVHSHIKKLLALRRTHAALRRGTQEFLLVDAKTCAFERVSKEGGVIVAINTASQSQKMELELSGPAWEGTIDLVDQLGEAGAVKIIDGRLTLQLPAGSASILIPTTAMAKVNP